MLACFANTSWQLLSSGYYRRSGSKHYILRCYVAKDDKLSFVSYEECGVELALNRAAVKHQSKAV
jgi:hypothetical protein